MRKKSANSIQTFADNFLENKSEKNFNKLYHRMAPAMRKYVYDYIKDYHISEAAVVNAFAKIWNKIDQYNDSYAFSTWAYRIARNEALMIVNSKKKTYSIDEMQEMGIVLTTKCPDLTYNPEYEFFEPSKEDKISALYELVLSEINNLPEKYRITLEMRLVKRMKLEEIAKANDWPVNTVKTRLRKALSLIEKRVKGMEPLMVENYMN